MLIYFFFLFHRFICVSCFDFCNTRRNAHVDVERLIFKVDLEKSPSIHETTKLLSTNGYSRSKIQPGSFVVDTTFMMSTSFPSHEAAYYCPQCAWRISEVHSDDICYNPFLNSAIFLLFLALSM